MGGLFATNAGGTRSAAVHRRDLRRVEPLTSAQLISAGVRPEFLAALVLRRASSDRIAKSDGHYFDWGHPTPSYLAGVFEELAETGLLTLAEADPWGMRRVSLTRAGQRRYQQLKGILQRAAPPAPDSGVVD